MKTILRYASNKKSSVSSDSLISSKKYSFSYFREKVPHNWLYILVVPEITKDTFGYFSLPVQMHKYILYTLYLLYFPSKYPNALSKY